MTKWTFVFLLLAAFSCQQNVKILTEQHTAEMVAYSEIINDSILIVQLSSTIAPSSGKDISIPYINGAEVILTNQTNGLRFQAELINSKGKYQCIFDGGEGEYYLTISSEFGSMQSEKIRIGASSLKRFPLTVEEFSSGFFNLTHQLRLTIPVEDYYFDPLILGVNLNGVDVNTGEIFTVLPNTSDEFDFRFLCDYQFGTRDDLVFSLNEKCINEQNEVQLEVAFTNEAVEFISLDSLAVYQTDQLEVEISIYSESYYRFLKEFISYDGIDLFFAIPNAPYSSYDNGYGYFIARNTKTYEIGL